MTEEQAADILDRFLALAFTAEQLALDVRQTSTLRPLMERLHSDAQKKYLATRADIIRLLGDKP